MPLKVLFVSRYVEPYPVGGNRNVFLQAQSLRCNFDVNLEILTWPKNDLWTGPHPPVSEKPSILSVEREGIKYHIFSAPDRFEVPGGGDELSVLDWEQAVEYGIKLLLRLNPEIVHLQHRHGLWWILESAQRLGIATIYTNHDWGIACMRTILVTGYHQLCDGVVEPKKCSACVRAGRSSLAGKINESLVSNRVGEKLAKLVLDIPFFGKSLKKRGFLTQKAEERTYLHYQRATRVLKRLSHCFTPSHFGASFFAQLGCPKDRITVLPWYHDAIKQSKAMDSDQPFTMTYVGRVSPEKGVDLVFSALERLSRCEPILFRVAGANDSSYCTRLKDKYPVSVGIHPVEWVGWTEVASLFQRTDVAVVPSQLIDNTPLSLVEALAYQTPVVATRVPPIEELLSEGKTGFFAEYGSIDSLADAIKRAAFNKAHIRNGLTEFPKVNGSKGYMEKVVEIYDFISKNRKGHFE